MKSAEQILREIVAYAKSVLQDNEEYLFGNESRPLDLYDCGYTDGEYNAFVTVLDIAGENHNYEKQGV